MTRSAFVARVLKPLLYIAAPLPAGWIGLALLTDRVEGDQVKFIQHVTGTTVLVSLLLTLAITPLRRATGWNELVRVRRLIGLTAFWYAVLHFLTYIVFDQSLSVGEIAKDVAKHPWVLVGFASFLTLLPLAITSTAGWIRRLGGKRWQQLHRLIYLAAVGGMLHYLWLVKKDVRTPLWFAAVLVLLFAARLWASGSRRAVPVNRGARTPAQRALSPAGEDAA